MKDKDLFDYIVGIASIASTIISLFALNGVRELRRQINNSSNKVGRDVRFHGKGDEVNQAAGNMKITKRK